MFQGAVVTLISNPIHVCVPLVHIIDVLAVVSFIEDICREQGTNKSQSLQPRLFPPNRTLTARAERGPQCLGLRCSQSGPYHPHQCLQRRRRPPRCCLCQPDRGCGCRGSCHSGLPRHLCRSHTGLGCSGTDSCPAKTRHGAFYNTAETAQDSNHMHNIYMLQKSATVIFYIVVIIGESSV